MSEGNDLVHEPSRTSQPDQRTDEPHIWVVMATAGEWSDRSEWPLEAYTDEAAAQTRVEECTQRVDAARASGGEEPQHNEDFDEEYWQRYDAALKTIEDLGGGGFDMRFFLYSVPLVTAHQRATLDGATKQNPIPTEGA